MLKFQYKFGTACIHLCKPKLVCCCSAKDATAKSGLSLCFFKYFCSQIKLEHVGVLNCDLEKSAVYQTGQTFLHRVFAYRGVILHAWNAHVYEKKCNPVPSNPSSKAPTHVAIVPKLETYYQVLVDSRDSLNSSAKCEVSYLKHSSKENFPIEKILDIDYVSHKDVIPYRSVEEVPVFHGLFTKFLSPSAGDNKMLQATETFQAWQERNRLWLEIFNVYIETTDCIRVTVIPFYLGIKSLVQPSVYWWRYMIRIENLGKETVQLCKRHWRIISDGSITRQSGRGVVGFEPILGPGQPAFQYCSQVPLWTPSGHMWGTYQFEKDGDQFDVCIPAFALESRSDLDSTLN